MRRPLVAGNWKMNGLTSSINVLLEGIRDVDTDRIDCAVFPPSVYLAGVVQTLKDCGIEVGAQDVDWRAQGAITGEIAVDMLADTGARFCLVGHSERRQLMGETDEVVASKFAACLDGGVVPVLCVGETLTERQSDETLEVVFAQVQAIVDRVGVAALDQAVVAYEPVWAIGTGESATPAQAQEVHGALRGFIAGMDADIASRLRLLYGGSVNAANAAALFTQEDIDGALVGGASLKAQEFTEIAKQAAF